MDNVVHKGLLATLQKSRTAADEVLEHMLAWDCILRPEMREVLLKPCWSEPEICTTTHASLRRDL
jgi:hypothetical protein